MPEILETFETYVARIERIQDQMENKPIIFSDEIEIPHLKGGDKWDIDMVPVAWPLYKYNHSMVYIVTVPPETRTPRHSHDEDLLRVVMKGSLAVNGREVKEGTWFVVRRNTLYQIETATGYKTIVFYPHRCMSAHPGGTHWIDEEEQPTS